VDQVLVMTVNPEFGHQHFLYSTLPKIWLVRQMIQQLNPECSLEVDGGIDSKTALLAVGAGANVLVVGTSVFGDRQGVAAAMKRLQAAANKAVNSQEEWEESIMRERITMQFGMSGPDRMGFNGLWPCRAKPNDDCPDFAVPLS
jgi:hypothetical protein